MYVHAKSLQSRSTLCNTMNCSPPGSSVHGILQARILEWVALLSSRGSSQPRDQTYTSYVSYIYTHISSSSASILLPHSTPLGHYRAPSWAPCAVQQLVTSYLFHTWSYINVSATLPIHSTLTFGPCVHMSDTLYVSLYSCPANSFISTIFLDFIYMCSYTLFVFQRYWLVSCVMGAKEYTYSIRYDMD